jgi:type I restriction enzyme M protein
LKFVGDKFNKRQEEIRQLPDYDEMYLEMPQFYLSQNVFFLNETSRWDYIVNNAFNWTKAANYNKETISVDRNRTTSEAFADEFMRLKKSRR